MIISALVAIVVGIIETLLDLCSLVTLPFDAVKVLASFTGYGAWIVGSDLLMLIITSIVTWKSAKMIIALTLWIWDKLPFV